MAGSGCVRSKDGRTGVLIGVLTGERVLGINGSGSGV